MELLALKWICAALLFLCALLSATLVLCLKRVSPRWMAICNAAAGGVLISVALVHMLSKSSDELGGWGRAIQRAFGGTCDTDACEAFPVGYVISLLGLFLILAVEQCTPHEHEELRTGNMNSDNDDTESGEEESRENTDGDVVFVQKRSIVAGLGTFVGISVHTFIESVALGAATEIHMFTVLLIAILLHKSFASFAVASSLVPVCTLRIWWSMVVIYASIPLPAFAIGLYMTNSSNQFAAAVQCFASGTLLAIGLSDMLLPALREGDSWRRRKLVAAFLASVAVAALALWT